MIDYSGRVGAAKAYGPYEQWLKRRKEQKATAWTGVKLGFKTGKGLSDIHRKQLNQEMFGKYTEEGKKMFQLKQSDNFLDRLSSNLWRQESDYELTEMAQKEGYVMDESGKVLTASEEVARRDAIANQAGSSPDISDDLSMQSSQDARDAQEMGYVRDLSKRMSREQSIESKKAKEFYANQPTDEAQMKAMEIKAGSPQPPMDVRYAEGVEKGIMPEGTTIMDWWERGKGVSMDMPIDMSTPDMPIESYEKTSAFREQAEKFYEGALEDKVGAPSFPSTSLKEAVPYSLEELKDLVPSKDIVPSLLDKTGKPLTEAILKEGGEEVAELAAEEGAKSAVSAAGPALSAISTGVTLADPKATGVDKTLSTIGTGLDVATAYAPNPFTAVGSLLVKGLNMFLS